VEVGIQPPSLRTSHARQTLGGDNVPPKRELAHDFFPSALARRRSCNNSGAYRRRAVHTAQVHRD